MKFYVYASKPKGHPFPLVSWLIRLFTWFDSSHVLIHYKEDGKFFDVYFNCLRFEDDKEYLEKITIKHAFEIECSKETYNKLIRLSESQKGKQFGYMLALLGTLLTMPFRWLNIYAENPLSKMFNTVTCSEAIARYFYNAFNIDLRPENVSFDNVTERDIVEMLERKQATRLDGTTIKKIL